MNKDFWKTTKGKSLIKLIIGFLFLLIIYLVFTFGFTSNTYNNSFSNENYNETREEEDNQNILDLTNKDYEFSYEVNVLDNVTKLEGNVTNNIEAGYKENSFGIIKYEKENNIVYQVTIAKKEEIPNFYQDLNEVFLDYNKLYEIINVRDCLNNYCENTYNDYKININKSSDSFNIFITKENESYNLKYFNIKNREGYEN